MNKDLSNKLFERYQELQWRGKAKEENFPTNLENSSTNYQWYVAGIESTMRLLKEGKLSQEELRNGIQDFLDGNHPIYYQKKKKNK